MPFWLCGKGRASLEFEGLGIQFERPLATRDGLIVPMSSPMDECHTKMDITGVGIESNRPFEFRVTLFTPSHHRKTHSEPMVRDGITGIQFNRTLEFLFCHNEVIVVMKGRPGE